MTAGLEMIILKSAESWDTFYLVNCRILGQLHFHSKNGTLCKF